MANQTLNIATLSKRLATMCLSVKITQESATYTYFSHAYGEPIASHFIWFDHDTQKVMMACCLTEQIHEIIFDYNLAIKAE
jgi:hypothetical protein